MMCGVLDGKRVLVLRAREQASALRDGLEALGAEVVGVPVIEIVPPESWAEMDEALGERWDWVVLTSVNAAESVAGRLRVLGREAGFARVAAVGTATEARARELGLVADEVVRGERAVAESLAEALVPRVRAMVGEPGGARVLVPRAERARDVLPGALRALGAEVRAVVAYRNQVPGEALVRLQGVFGAGGRGVDAVAFSSSSSVTGLLGALREAGVQMGEGVRCVSIGEITSGTMRACGLRVDAEAVAAGVPGLVEAVVWALA